MPERMVAVLFVTGFMSAGLTAPLVGVWADQQCVFFSFNEAQGLNTAQWPQEVVSRVLYHLHLCVSLHQRALPPCSVLWTSHGWGIHIHPLFRFRVVVGLLRQLSDYPVLRSFDHLWSCDTC